MSGWTIGDYDRLREVVRKMPMATLRSTIPDDVLRALVLNDERALRSVAPKKTKRNIVETILARKTKTMRSHTRKFLKAVGWTNDGTFEAVIERFTEEDGDTHALSLVVRQAGVTRLNVTRRWTGDDTRAVLGTAFDESEVYATEENVPPRSAWKQAIDLFFGSL